MMGYRRRILAAWGLALFGGMAAADGSPPLFFAEPSTNGWRIEDQGVWAVDPAPEQYTGGQGTCLILRSNAGGEEKIGRAVSPPFIITEAFQEFVIAGADGTETGRNDGDMVYVRLLSHPDGAELRRERPPGIHILTPARWITADLIGREVVLEVVDQNPRIRPDGFAWIAIGDYRQRALETADPVRVEDLYGLPIDTNATAELCRSIPFLCAPPEGRGETRRTMDGDAETIPVGAPADTLYLLGMINHGWDCGVAHWGEHPELSEMRDDQVPIGTTIGTVEIHYADGAMDSVPLVTGATAWYYEFWVVGTSHNLGRGCREPIASRPDIKTLFDASFRLREDDRQQKPHNQYYLSIRPQPKPIESIVVRDNPARRGRPLVSAITLKTAAPSDGLRAFGKWTADRDDLAPHLDARNAGDVAAPAKALADALYMREEDLPDSVDLLPFPTDLDATEVRFLGGVEGDMLTNVWTANLALIAEKFPADTGVFWESVPEVGPWYGGYNGFGTWCPAGIYYGEDMAFARCTDHYATLALRLINNPTRLTRFVDYVDHWLYFYRHDHDPANGPPNDGLDLEAYPKDAQPNWSFVINSPLGMPMPIDPVPGGQETCGHGATVVARWLAWRHLGSPIGGWLDDPRPGVFGKSRWDSTFDAAEFICWYMDYTGMDVMFSEGETTGWAGGAPGTPGSLVPFAASEANTLEDIRRFYANSNMYEPYPTWVCCVGLRCSAAIAEATGKTDLAERWRQYAKRLEDGMYRLLRVGDHRTPMWRVSPHSVYPSLQDSLVHAWFAFYFDGYDPNRWDPMLTRVTRNTLQRQLNQPYGHAPVLAMGYGQGWLTKAALLLDEMDDAGPLLWNIAKYTYDKNMDFVDETRRIDWRRWLYIIPEGTNILEDGRWHRIGDLSNGANQGPPMHAIEICAGVDDTHPGDLRIMPRVPDPLTGIEVKNHFALLQGGGERARISYQFERTGRFVMESDVPLPRLSVRLGPFSKEAAERFTASATFLEKATVRTEVSGRYEGREAWWVWVENLSGVQTLRIAP